MAGERVNEAARSVTFERLKYSEKLDLGIEFEFRKWRLHYKSSGGTAGFATTGVSEMEIIDSAWEIDGTR